MKLSADELRRLASLPPEALPEVLKLLADRAEAEEAVEAKEAVERDKAVIRQRRHRDKQRDNAVTDSVTVTPDPPSLDPPHTPPITLPPGKPLKLTNAGAREELEKVLDAEHAQAVIEHRKAKKAPLTPHAAKLLAKAFAQAENPNEAADVMIAHGWQGFQPSWLHRANNGTSTRSPPKQSPIMDALDEVMNEAREKSGRSAGKN